MKISNHPDKHQDETSGSDIDRGSQSSKSGIHASVKVGFFIGQAIILLSFPFEVLAAFSELPGFVEAQANEALIVALCANIPFVIVCEIVAWVAFVKKQTIAMLVATIIPILVLAILVISGNLF